MENAPRCRICAADTTPSLQNQNERTQAVEDVQTLKGDLARLQEEFRHTQELKNLASQEESAAARLSYERLLADKRVVDTRLHETEASMERRQT